MARNFLSIILLLSLLVIIAGFFLKFSGSPDAFLLWNIGGGIFLLAGTFALAKEGSFFDTVEFKLTGIPLAAFLIGVMFKIMHWPGSAILIAAGMTGIFLLYLIHFIKKNQKRLPDYGKVAFLVSFLAGRFLSVMHLPKGREVSFFALMILVLLVTTAYIEKSRALKHKASQS